MVSVTVVISGQYGGSDAGAAAMAPVREVKEALRTPIETAGEVGLTVAVQLFVSGEITTFDGPSGPSNLRLHLARGRVTCDVTMGTEVWTGGRENVIRFVTSAVADVVQGGADRLRKKGVELDPQPVRDALDLRTRELLGAG